MAAKIKNKQFFILLFCLLAMQLILLWPSQLWIIPVCSCAILAIWFLPASSQVRTQVVKSEHINIRDWVSKLPLNQPHQLFEGGDCCYYLIHLDRENELIQPQPEGQTIKSQNILIMEGEGEIKISGKRFALRQGDLLSLPYHLEVSAFHPHTTRMLVLWRIAYV